MITVIHKRNAKNVDSEKYIGRPSSLGNPFVIGKDGDRANVIKLYEGWLQYKVYVEKNPAILSELHIIAERERNNKNTQLVCWCAPRGSITSKDKPWICHGQVIANCIEKVVQTIKEK